MPPTTSNRAPRPSGRASAAAKRPRQRTAPSQADPAQPISDRELPALFAPLASYDPVILAVSGGADSMALMHLVARWAPARVASGRILIATVDHGLRADARKEAEWVAAEARAKGFRHELLVWDGAKPQSALQDAARSARYRLLRDLALRLGGPGGTAAIVTAHTEDDQAETFLMRLARGSGLDGLTGMSAARGLARAGTVQLLRPLLAIAGARLRATLRAEGLRWIEDPSNVSDRFERARLRKARAELAALGLTNDKIALSARRLDRARSALEAAADALQRACGLDLHGGAYASFAASPFATAAVDVRLRMLARLIVCYGGKREPVRLAKLEQLLDRLDEAGFAGATLAGAAVARRGDEVAVFREPGRSGLPEVILQPGEAALWDGRFQVGLAAQAQRPLAVRALGVRGFADLRRQLKDRNLPPARAAATLPAFWRGKTLIAVPGLGWPESAGESRNGGLCSVEFVC